MFRVHSGIPNAYNR